MLIKMKATLAVRSSLLVIASLLGACSLMPDYERPATPVAARTSEHQPWESPGKCEMSQ